MQVHDKGRARRGTSRGTIRGTVRGTIRDSKGAFRDLLDVHP